MRGTPSQNSKAWRCPSKKASCRWVGKHSTNMAPEKRRRPARKGTFTNWPLILTVASPKSNSARSPGAKARGTKAGFVGFRRSHTYIHSVHTRRVTVQVRRFGETLGRVIELAE